MERFFARDPSFVGGLSVAVGDAFGDGTPDILVGTSADPFVRVLSGIGGTPLGQIEL